MAPSRCRPATGGTPAWLGAVCARSAGRFGAGAADGLIALPLGAGTAVAEAREIDDAGHLRGPGADRRRDEHRGRGLGRHRPPEDQARAACRAAAAARGAAAAREPLHKSDRPGQSQGRRELGEILPAVDDPRPEVRAAFAVAQVSAQPAPSQHAAVALGDRPADSVALHLATLSHLLQRESGLVDELAGRLRRAVEAGGDLLEAQAAELAHDERAPLAVGQLAQVVDELAQPFDRGGVGIGGGNGETVGIELHSRAPLTEQRDRLVVGDAVQPRLERDLAPLAGQGAHRADHRVL